MTRSVFTHHLAFDGGGTPPVPGEVTIDRDRMLAAIGARATAQLTGGADSILLELDDVAVIRVLERG